MTTYGYKIGYANEATQNPDQTWTTSFTTIHEASTASPSLRTLGEVKVNLSRDDIDSATFNIYPTNPYFDDIRAFDTRIIICPDDGALSYGTALFCGRVVKVDKVQDSSGAFYKTVLCASMWDYLRDAYISTRDIVLDMEADGYAWFMSDGTYAVKANIYFKRVIQALEAVAHVIEQESLPKFRIVPIHYRNVGYYEDNVFHTFGNAYINPSDSVTVMDALNDLQAQCGGEYYLSWLHEGSSQDSEYGGGTSSDPYSLIIDWQGWLPGAANSTNIQLGQTMVNMEQSTDWTSIVTAIKPTFGTAKKSTTSAGGETYEYDAPITLSDFLTMAGSEAAALRTYITSNGCSLIDNDNGIKYDSSALTYGLRYIPVDANNYLTYTEDANGIQESTVSIDALIEFMHNVVDYLKDQSIAYPTYSVTGATNEILQAHSHSDSLICGSATVLHNPLGVADVLEITAVHIDCNDCRNNSIEVGIPAKVKTELVRRTRGNHNPQTENTNATVIDRQTSATSASSASASNSQIKQIAATTKQTNANTTQLQDVSSRHPRKLTVTIKGSQYKTYEKNYSYNGLWCQFWEKDLAEKLGVDPMNMMVTSASVCARDPIHFVAFTRQYLRVYQNSTSGEAGYDITWSAFNANTSNDYTTRHAYRLTVLIFDDKPIPCGAEIQLDASDISSFYEWLT